MKKILLTLTLSSLALIMFSQTPNFSWAVGTGRAGNESAAGTCKDIYGNIYVTGIFTSDTTYFGSLMCVRPAGVTEVIYTVKYDTLGNAIWVKTGSGTGTNSASDITTDSIGNIYVVGTYVNASITFGSTILTNAGGTNFTKDICLVKYDNAGTMLWARRYGGVNQDVPADIEIDISGNILMSGVFASPTLVFGSTTLANSTGSSPNDDSFVVKMDAAGNPIWAKMGNDLNSGYSCSNGSTGVSSDPAGNVYITGRYECNTTFSPISLTGIPTTTSGYNIYVVKYNSSGTIVWAKSFTSTNNLSSNTISVDQYSNVYIGGSYYAPVTFGPTTLTITGNYDAFFVKLKPDGTVSWAKKIGASGTEEIKKLRSDQYGYVTLTGTYTTTTTVGTTSLTLTAGSIINTCDMFVAKYDSLGTVVWVKKAGGIRDDNPSSICFSNDAVYITGKFTSPTFIFTPPTLANYSAAGSTTDMFLSKICTNPFQPSTITGPTTGCAGTYTYSVLPVVGASSYTWTLPSGWTGSSTTNSITVTTGSTGGTISVFATSGCCTSLSRTLAVTITAVPAMPAAISGTTTLCAGVTQLYSITAVSGATSYTWTLPSGWSGSSTTTSITVTTGTNSGNVQVNANNACGSGPAQTAAITISLSGSSAFPFLEGFQTLPFVPTGWTLYNPNADLTWVRSTTTGGFGASSACTFFNNYSGALSGGRDAVRTPRFDFTSCSSASLKFDVAYARRNAVNIDSLNVYASTNCGITWTRIYGKGSTSLATAPDYSAALFVPTAVQWRTDSINISAYVGQPNVMFSLENKSGLGQGLYLDNVNITVVNAAANVSIAQTSGGTPICTGTTVEFTATPVAGGTPTYQWKINSVNVGTNSPLFTTSSLNNNDTVICVMTSSIVGVLNNPATSNQIIVSVSPLIAPTVTISASSSSVCTGGSVTLTGAGATTYSWSGGITNGVSFTPVATATYTLTGTDAAGCQNSAVQTIPVNPLPTITSSTTASIICAGTSVTLTGAGAHTYSWTGGAINGVPVFPSSTTTYTVTGTDTITGCQNTSTRNIIVNAIPVVTAAATSSVLCAGESTILSGGGANTYTWSGGVTNNVLFVPSSTVTYTVTGTITSSGCSDTTSITVVVNPLPAITIVSTATAVCTGTNVTFTASGADSYSWSGGINNGVAFVPSTTATYIVTGTTTSTGCQDTAWKSITVYALPNVTATSSAAEICTGGSVTLTGSGATSYSWDYGVTNGVAFIPAATQVYTLIGTDIHGCADTVLKTVVVNAFPVAAVCTPITFPSYISPLNYFKVDTVSGPAGTYWASNGPSPGNQTCVNQLHVTEGSTYYFAFNLSSTLCGKVGMWIDYNNDGNLPPAEYVNGNPPSYPIYTVCYTGYYPITVTIPAGAVLNTPLRMRIMTYDNSYDGLVINGCFSGLHGRYYDYTVYIGPALPPIANFVASDTSVCIGESVNFSNTSTYATSQLWDFGDGTTSSAVSPSHAYAAAGTYTVQLNAINSSGNDSLVLTNYIVVQPSPVIIATSSAAAVCAGDSITLSGSGALSYTWDSGVTDGLAFLPAASGVYHVNGIDVNGCSGSDSIAIVVNPLPATPVISQSGSDLISTASLFYQWFLNGSSTSGTSQIYTPVQDGNYSVAVTDANGCSATSAIFVFDMVWPGDANNDSLVNNFDILPIGIFYSQSGSARSIVSNSWQAYPSIDWGTTQTNGSDIKHTDCNGDGLIDDNDTLAVNLNFSLVHAIAGNNSNDARLLDSDLYFVTSGTSYNAGDIVIVEVWAGSSVLPVSNLYGIAFNIDYDVSLVQPGTESLTYPTSWLGAPGIDAITIAKIDGLSATAFGGITRIDHTNRNGFGKIADFKFQAKTSISSTSVLHLSFSNYQANDSVGVSQLFNTLTDSIAIYPLTTGVLAETNNIGITIYPNPFTEQTTITFSEEQKNISIKILDVFGKEIRVVNFSGKRMIIEKGEMGSGVYFVQVIDANKNVFSKRIIIQ